MATGSRRATYGLVAALVALLLAAVVLFLRPLMSANPLQAAVGDLPASVLRISFTDWAAVGEDKSATGVDGSSSADDLDSYVGRAFEKDLTVTSSLATSFPGLAANFGVTPLDADWEVYGQAPEGSVAILRLADDVDLDELEGTFDALGYQAPADGAGSGGVWQGSADLVVGLDEPLATLQENLAVLPDERLFLMSDGLGFLETSIGAVQGDEPTLASDDALGAVLSSVEEPQVAMAWVGDFACEDLAMSQADPSDDQDGKDLVTEAGGVHPLTGLLFAQDQDRSLHIVMGYDSDDQASADVQARADLASGPAPGQGGAFTDRFTVTSAVADGSLVRIDADPEVPRVLSDLTQGPVLFAAC